VINRAENIPMHQCHASFYVVIGIHVKSPRGKVSLQISRQNAVTTSAIEASSRRAGMLLPSQISQGEQQRAQLRKVSWKSEQARGLILLRGKPCKDGRKVVGSRPRQTYTREEETLSRALNKNAELGCAPKATSGDASAAACSGVCQGYAETFLFPTFCVRARTRFPHDCIEMRLR